MFSKEDFSDARSSRSAAARREPEIIDMELPNNMEELNRELAAQQERLATLKRQQEEVESKKRELEELTRRRQELTSGQKNMREKLTRAITLFERSSLEIERELETVRAAHKSFQSHLRDIEAIDPKSWDPQDFDDQLTRALSIIDHAKASYAQSRVKLEALTGRLAPEVDAESSDEEIEDDFSKPPFLELMRRGLAFSLPLMILIAAIAFLLFTR